MRLRSIFVIFRVVLRREKLTPTHWTKVWKLGETVDEAFGNTVAQIFRLRVAAGVLERQHCHRVNHLSPCGGAMDKVSNRGERSPARGRLIEHHSEAEEARVRRVPRPDAAGVTCSPLYLLLRRDSLDVPSLPTVAAVSTVSATGRSGASLANPKSRILACPRWVMKILAGLMSRCTISFACAASSASAI